MRKTQRERQENFIIYTCVAAAGALVVIAHAFGIVP